MNLWQAIKLLKRRWWLIGLITGVVTGTVFVYFYSQPREWEGYAVIAEYRSLQANRTVILPRPLLAAGGPDYAPAEHREYRGQLRRAA
jgi:uncharacterized protein involved in exopolysaccharide biosynthesis